jgi:hypothetical protein
MTNIVEANEKIAQLFVDTWTTTGHEYTLENEKFDPPDDAPWARFTSRISASSQDTLGVEGSRKFERSGSVLIQIFVPTNSGSKVSKELAGVLLQAFEGQRITGTTIHFLDVIPRETGPDGNKWYQTIVEVNFNFYETK